MLKIENIEYKAIAMIENYEYSEMTEEYSLEEYIDFEYENDPDFFNWLLRPWSEEEQEELENLSVSELESFVNELKRECLNMNRFEH